MNYEERLFRQKQGYECYPWIFYAAATAISAYSAAATSDTQRRGAHAQQDYQQQLVKANNVVNHNQEAALRAQEAQDAEARAQANNQAQLQSQAAKSTAKVATGEAGVAGSSVDALLAEYDAHLGQYRDATARQGQFTKQGIESQIEGIRLGGGFSNLQINSPVALPNNVALGVKAVGEIYGAYNAYKGSNVASAKSPAVKAPTASPASVAKAPRYNVN